MTNEALKNKILEGGFDKDFSLLYTDVSAARERYAKAVDAFTDLYGARDNLRLFSAPGRTEVGGNHTDHQHGCVLAGSVHLDVIAVVSENNENTIRIRSAGFPMDIIDIGNLSVLPEEKGKSAALIRGVCAAFKNKGYALGGFDAYTTSNVLKGSGLSSSAAFEVLVANIVNGLYNQNKVDAVNIAKYSQFAECEYFGKPCGLLDQMASSVGGFTYADFFDPANPVVEKIDVDFGKSGYTLCVVDTGGNHSDLTQDYADITVEMKAVSEFLGNKTHLRNVSEEEFYQQIGALRKACGDRAVLRAFHYFNESHRVQLQKKALENADFETFFSEVTSSGNSSYKYLQNLYSNSNVSEQGLCLAIALTKRFLDGKGACRVHGGGFAGTIQCYIPNGMLNSYIDMIEDVFGKDSCVPLKIRPVGGYELK
ncbi:MAG: galactokinase [Clostridia bacterium]|nr:galactokinase [Clostridia bacterium]